MRQLIFDTNVLIPFLLDQKPFMKVLSKYDKLLLPSTVLGEFRAGLFETRAGIRNGKALEDFLQRSFVGVVPVVERTAELYAKVYQALRKEGRPIPQNDMWIAASALEHCADIATFDEHFKLVPMLTVLLCG